MVKTVRSVSVFLSSPSDLSREREIIADICNKISLDLGDVQNFSINLLRWETHVYSSKGTSAQDVITKQIGQDYDIFLGMMAGRFGTPTEKFGSGTEEEFMDALERNRKTSKPEIMFFFQNRKKGYVEIDAEQLLKIQQFRKLLGREGVLYSTFDDEISLWGSLYSQLAKAIRVVLENENEDTPVVEKEPILSIFDPLSEWHSLLASDSEVNASILIQKAGQSINDTNAEIHLLNKCTGNLLRSMNRETKSLAAPITIENAPRILKSINTVTTEIKNTTRQYLDIIPRLHLSLKECVEYALRSISIFIARGDLSGQARTTFAEPLSSFCNTLEALGATLETVHTQLAVDYAPGTAFSVEQKKFAAVLRDLRRVIENGAVEMRKLEAAVSA